MSSRITRCPEAAITIGARLLDYFYETMYDRLRFANDKNEPQRLRTYTDSSFAPSSGKSHGLVVLFYGSCPLAWRSSRQPLIALSTAEIELMEGVEGAVMTYTTKCLSEELLGETLPISLHIDNSAAISLITTLFMNRAEHNVPTLARSCLTRKGSATEGPLGHQEQRPVQGKSSWMKGFLVLSWLCGAKGLKFHETCTLL